jgi:transposase InsO family protein
VARYAAERVAGSRDCSSRPHRLNRPTPQHVVARIGEVRRQRLSGTHIAASVGVSADAVSRVLKRMGLNRDLELGEPVRRHEREHPGELIHIDIKKLGRCERLGHRITGGRTGQSNSRGAGWEFVHVSIDDASRVAFTRIMPDEKAVSAVAFFKAAVACYASFGVKVARVMTDNGPAYKSFAFARACRRLKIKHLRTKPSTPKTNRKAERHPDCAARMGLRKSLSELRSKSRRAADLDAPI